MSTNIMLEAHPKFLPYLKVSPYPKDKFAKDMNCSVKLLDNLELLTSLVRVYNNPIFSKLTGNSSCRYCHREYKTPYDKGKNETSISISGYCDRPINVKLMVPFWTESKCIKTTKGYLRGVIKSNYNFFSEYFEIDKGYWLR